MISIKYLQTNKQKKGNTNKRKSKTKLLSCWPKTVTILEGKLILNKEAALLLEFFVFVNLYTLEIFSSLLAILYLLRYLICGEFFFPCSLQIFSFLNFEIQVDIE